MSTFYESYGDGDILVITSAIITMMLIIFVLLAVLLAAITPIPLLEVSP